MKRILIFALAATCTALAQGPADVFFQAPMQAGRAVAINATGWSSAVVKGAPYSATMTNESVQTLADGTRIVQSSDGSVARDSQGRTRQDAPLPMIGGLSASGAPHLVMIQDPVADLAYTLNLTDKTAWKHAIPPVPPTPPAAAGAAITTNTVIVRSTNGVGGQLPPPPPNAPMVWTQRLEAENAGDVTTEDLGTQTMEGVVVTGVRTTRTIPAGKIGNDRPINIVTEVWTSPELKTIVLSKRNDPRFGEQTFKLTTIQRGEPDPALFTVPSDFKTTDNGAETIIYRTKH
jgi:hypothetical protein